VGGLYTERHRLQSIKIKIFGIWEEQVREYNDFFKTERFCIGEIREYIELRGK
jgi:hypothetical protein